MTPSVPNERKGEPFMGELKQSDILEIMKLFERELNSLSRISRLERLQMRKQINRVVSAGAVGVQNPKAFLTIINDKLSKQTAMFLDENVFKRRLERLLNDRMKK
jgi:hypothetical protein